MGAVRIVKETGKPVAQVARDLDVSPYTLRNWMQMDRRVQEQSEGDGTLTVSEREELARLRGQKAEPAKEHARDRVAWEKERAELEMERDVLIGSVGGRVGSRRGLSFSLRRGRPRQWILVHGEGVVGGTSVEVRR